MLVRLECPRCGDSGDDGAIARGATVTCSACRASYAVRLVDLVGPSEASRVELGEIPVADWLGARPLPPARPIELDAATCAGCGYEGPMLSDPDQAAPLCPACGRSQRPSLAEAVTRGRLPETASASRAHLGRYEMPDPVRRMPCPDCGRPVEAMRGKTVICPSCNHFVGCLYPEVSERRHWWRG